VAGFYVYFIFRLREIKVEMKAELRNYPTEKLLQIVMSPMQYQKAKNDEGEVKWQGYMYDVARVEFNSNTVSILALRDEAETSLMGFIDKIVEMTDRDEKSPPQALVQFHSLVFTPPTITKLSTLHCQVIVKHTPFLIPTYSSNAVEVLAPPPRAQRSV
jgi:hypothetical protein